MQAHKELALSQADTMRIQAMIATLKETSRYHASSFADVDFKLLTKMVLQWPVENIFPGINSKCSHVFYVSSVVHPSTSGIIVGFLMGHNFDEGCRDHFLRLMK